MKFPNYIELIKSKKELLINSYVKQYGEEYRERISTIFDKINWCIFTNRASIEKYCFFNSLNSCIEETINFFEELGINKEKFKISENGLYSEDNTLDNLLNIYFPFYNSINLDPTSKEEGIFMFTLPNDETLKFDKISFWLKLGYNIDFNISDSLFNELNNKYKKIANLALKHRKKIFKQYEEMLEYAKNFEKRNQVIKNTTEKEIITIFEEILTDKDKKMLKNAKCDLEKLDCYNFFFFKNSFGRSALQLMPSTFLQNTEKQDKKAIPGIKKDLLTREKLEEIRKTILKYDNILTNRIAESYILQSTKENPELSKEILNSSDSICNIEKDKDIDIYLNIFSDFHLIDVIIDHEIRHAIESNIETTDEIEIIKSGSEVSYIKNDKEIENHNKYFNELVTQALSVESASERWKNGKCIIWIPKKEEINKKSTAYDKDIIKIEGILQALGDSYIKDRMDPKKDLEIMYNFMPKNKWNKLEEYLLSIENDKEFLEDFVFQMRRNGGARL